MAHRFEYPIEAWTAIASLDKHRFRFKRETAGPQLAIVAALATVGEYGLDVALEVLRGESGGDRKTQ